MKQFYFNNRKILISVMDAAKITRIKQLTQLTTISTREHLKQLSFQSFNEDFRLPVTKQCSKAIQQLIAALDQRIYTDKQLQNLCPNLIPFRNSLHNVAFNESLNHYQMMNLTCLGCTQFMYKNQSIKYKEITKTDAIVFDSILDIGLYNQKIKESMEALVNRGGGVILFACKEQNTTIIAMGQEIKQQQCQTILKKLMNCTKQLYPQIQFELRFVPVIAKLQNEEKQQPNNFIKIPNINKQEIKMQYVTVFKVWPIQTSQTVFYLSQGSMIIHRRKNGQNTQIKGREILKYVKGKFFRNYVTQQQKEYFSQNTHCFSDHECTKPDKSRLSNYLDQLTQALNLYQLQNRFEFISIFWRFQNSSETINDYLRQNNIGLFSFKKLQKYAEFSLLFHNRDSIRNLIRNFSNQFGQQNSKFIDIRGLLILNNNMTFQQFKRVQLFLKGKNSLQNLLYYQSQNGEDSYLKTSKKISYFYLFCYLRSIQFRNISFRNLSVYQINELRRIYP